MQVDVQQIKDRVARESDLIRRLRTELGKAVVGQDYLDADPQNAERAEVLYRIGTPHVQADQFDEAAAALVRAELAVANHADARHNLELIRHWIKHMEDLWRQRDRQKEREEKGLLEFLLMIEAQQRALRAGTKSLAGQPDSPQRRQALATTESSQRTLTEEIEPLKEKIEAEVGSPQPSGQSPQQAPGAAVSPEAAEKPEVLVEAATLRGRPVEQIYEGQSVLYTVTLNHAENPSPPKLEGFDDFEVTSLGEQSLDSTRVTIINGQMTRVVRRGREYRYRLTPRRGAGRGVSVDCGRPAGGLPDAAD